MSEAVQEFLHSFDRLQEFERQKVYLEIRKRVQALAPADLDDEMLTRLADQSFQMSDAEEAENGRG